MVARRLHRDVSDDDAALPVVRERLKVGAGISPGFRSISRDKNEDMHVVRHNVALLEEISTLKRDDVPGYLDAKITRVRELAAKRAKPEPARGEVIEVRTRTVLRRDCGVILGIR